MDLLTWIAVIAGIVTIVAGVVEVIDYLQRRVRSPRRIGIVVGTLVLLVVLVGVLALRGVPGGPTPTPTKPPAPPAAATATPVPPTKPIPTQVPPTATRVLPTATPAPKQVTISIWHGWGGDYYAAIETAFKDYQKANPGVTIQLSKPDNLYDALKIAIPAKNGPDIFAWANDQIGVNASAGYIVDLSKYGVDRAFLQS